MFRVTLINVSIIIDKRVHVGKDSFAYNSKRTIVKQETLASVKLRAFRDGHDLAEVMFITLLL